MRDCQLTRSLTGVVAVIDDTAVCRRLVSCQGMQAVYLVKPSKTNSHACDRERHPFVANFEAQVTSQRNRHSLVNIVVKHTLLRLPVEFQNRERSNSLEKCNFFISTGFIFLRCITLS